MYFPSYVYSYRISWKFFFVLLNYYTTYSQDSNWRYLTGLSPTPTFVVFLIYTNIKMGNNNIKLWITSSHDRWKCSVTPASRLPVKKCKTKAYRAGCLRKYRTLDSIHRRSASLNNLTCQEKRSLRGLEKES